MIMLSQKGKFEAKESDYDPIKWTEKRRKNYDPWL